MLYATVRQRKIHVKNPAAVIQNGVGVDQLTLNMDDEWALLDRIVCVFTLRYAVETKETVTEEVKKEDGSTETVEKEVVKISTEEIAREMLHTFGEPVQVPWECLQKTGLLSVSCTGYDAEGTRVMTSMMPDSFWTVVQNGPVTGDTPMEATPSLYDQIMAVSGTAQEAAAAADAVREQLLQDKENGVFDGVSPTVEVGAVITGAPGSEAQVVNTGTSQNVKLSFVLPGGAPGVPGPRGPQGVPGADGPRGGYYIPEVSGGYLSWTASDDEMSQIGSTTKIVGATGPAGKDGATYFPSVSEDGVLSWTPSEPTLPVPRPSNLKGKDGFSPTITVEEIGAETETAAVMSLRSSAVEVPGVNVADQMAVRPLGDHCPVTAIDGGYSVYNDASTTKYDVGFYFDIDKDVLPQIAGEKWYFGATVGLDVARQDTLTQGVSVNWFANFSSGLQNFINVTYTTEYPDAPVDYCAVLEVPADSASSLVSQLRARYFSPAAIAGGRTCTFTNLVLVNLTDTYGAGSEPTAEEYHALLTGGEEEPDEPVEPEEPENPDDPVEPDVPVSSGTGYKLTITDVNGTTEVGIYNGVSPEIAVEGIPDGHRLSITDGSGTQTVDIMDGAAAVPATNYVVNGGFSDASSWSVISGGTLTVEDGKAVVSLGDGSAGTTAGVTQSVDLGSRGQKTGDKLFFLAHVEAEAYNIPSGAVGNMPWVRIITNGASGYISVVSTTASDLADDYYGIQTLTADSTAKLTLRLDVPYNKAEYAAGHVCKFSRAAVFNLTEIFGAGNEPDADSFYQMLGAWDGHWFDGTQNLAGTAALLAQTVRLSPVIRPTVVTVGAGGDFGSINEALRYLSQLRPVWKNGGMNAEICILGGTIIHEQIRVHQQDLSWISITTDAADNTVQVDVTDWGGVTHDTRGNRPFFSGESGARLPCIKCLFSCIVPEGGWTSDNYAVGYFCNRGSMGVIEGEATYNGSVATGVANIGFENFYDNIIANNNSEIVAREAVARNASRYGILSRHISRVSARSADITGCGEIAAYTDRASMMDVRHADLSGSKNAIAAYHASIVTANETTANNITGVMADSQYGSTINCNLISAANVKDAFAVTGGATIVATAAVMSGVSGTTYSVTKNTLTADGIIYA